MATKTTHPFKTTSSLTLSLDIYTPPSLFHSQTYPRFQPILLYFHPGSFITSNRLSIPPHIIQLCLMRNWILVSADYRKLPQITGTEIWEDARDAYLFVRERLPGLLAGRNDGGARFENVVVVGREAGAYLAYLCGHYMDPKPVAILSYYGMTSMSDPFFDSGFQTEKKGLSVIGWERVRPFYSEGVTLGETALEKRFDPDCLSKDSGRNPEWRPELEEKEQERMALMKWFLQENQYPELMEDVDVDLRDEEWKEFPPTILVHGDRDLVIPYECSVRLVEAIGVPPAKLFTAVGRGHQFDERLFVGDPELSVIEEAWICLDEAVKAKLQEDAYS